MTYYSSHDDIVQCAELILQWDNDLADESLTEDVRCCIADLLSMEVEALQRTIIETSLYWVFPILKSVEETWVQENQCPVPDGGFGEILTYETELGEIRSFNRTESWQNAQAVSELSPRVSDEIRRLALNLARSGSGLWFLNNLVEALIGRPIREPIDEEPSELIEQTPQVNWVHEGF